MEEGVRRVAPLPLLFVKLLVNAPLGASAAPLDNDGLPCGAHDVPVGARAPPPTSRSAPAPPLTASQPSSPRFLRKHPRLEGCNTGLRFSRKHPRGCISIQPQIIPAASSVGKAGPGPKGRGITWSYTGSCKRTSQNLPSTHSGE